LRVDPETGFPEDRWFRQMREKSAKYGEAYQEMQVATMELSVARLIANGQDLSLFGDNLFLDLDLSGENLPAGSQLRIGEARFQVTPFPHDGCSLFRARFGEDALRFTANPKTRGKNLRGIYLKVLEPGILNVEDPVEVLQRGPTAD
jgi:MOSC domain-containing protein YiiM